MPTYPFEKKPAFFGVLAEATHTIPLEKKPAFFGVLAEPTDMVDRAEGDR